MAVQINCQLQQSVFFAGNIIVGCVNISCHQPVQFHSIRAEAVGTEWTKVRYTVQVPNGHDEHGHPRYRTETRYEEQTTIVYRQVVTLAGCMESQGNGQGMVYPMPPGQYQYPVAFQLPGGIPPTMASDEANFDCRISYCMNVKLDLAGNNYDPSSPVPFTVLTPMPVAQHATFAPHHSKKMYDVTCCFCCDKGKIGIEIGSQRTLIALDTDNGGVGAYVNIDNTQGEEPCQAITLQLVNEIQGQANGRRASSATVIGKLVLSDVVPAGGKKDGMTGIMKLTPFANPTASSCNLRSSYKVVVTADIPWADDVVFSFPALVAHNLDMSNYNPPVREATTYIGPQFLPEVFYAPPPQNMYASSQWAPHVIPMQQQMVGPTWQMPSTYYSAQPGAYFQ